MGGMVFSHTLSRCHEGLNLRPLVCKSMPFSIELDPVGGGITSFG